MCDNSASTSRFNEAVIKQSATDASSAPENEITNITAAYIALGVTWRSTEITTRWLFPG